jgi:hypothetical protein
MPEVQKAIPIGEVKQASADLLKTGLGASGKELGAQLHRGCRIFPCFALHGSYGNSAATPTI